MTDKYKRQGSMSDADRTLNRRKTSPRGVPVEVDPELTPPPQIPPELELGDADLESQVEMLRATVIEQGQGIARVWDMRNAGDQIARLHVAMSALVKESAETGALLRDFIMPATKTMMARLDVIERTASSELGRLARFLENDFPRLLDSLEKVDRRLDLVERQLDRQERSQDAMAKRADEQNSNLRGAVEALQRAGETRDGRIRHLEDFNLSLKAKVALVSSTLSGVVALAAWVIERYV